MKPTTLQSALVYCLAAVLTIAPVSHAAEAFDLPATPLNHDFVFSVEGGLAELAFKKVDNGYLYWSTKGEQAPKLLTNAQIAEFAPAEIQDGSRYRIALQDGLGGGIEYHIVPDMARNGLTGRVESMGVGGVSRAYSIDFADGAARDRGGRLNPKSDVILIVIGAAAIGAIGCAWNAIATDCASDCSSACGGRMLSSSEGMCGQCTCNCQAS